jgi:hypothetical protein
MAVQRQHSCGVSGLLENCFFDRLETQKRFRNSMRIMIFNVAKLLSRLGSLMIWYDDRVRCGTFLLMNLQLGELVFFTCYATIGHVPLMSSFLLTLLEFYGLQLHHLSPHSLILVAISVHFCEKFICVRPSVTLFRLFHMLQWAGKGMNPIGTHHLQQVGSLEGGLGDHARQRSGPPCATNRGPNRQAR